MLSKRVGELQGQSGELEETKKKSQRQAQEKDALANRVRDLENTVFEKDREI